MGFGGSNLKPLAVFAPLGVRLRGDFCCAVIKDYLLSSNNHIFLAGIVN